MEWDVFKSSMTIWARRIRKVAALSILLVGQVNTLLRFIYDDICFVQVSRVLVHLKNEESSHRQL